MGHVLADEESGIAFMDVDGNPSAGTSISSIIVFIVAIIRRSASLFPNTNQSQEPPLSTHPPLPQPLLTPQTAQMPLQPFAFLLLPSLPTPKPGHSHQCRHQVPSIVSNCTLTPRAHGARPSFTGSNLKTGLFATIRE